MRKIGAFIWYQKLHFDAWIQKWSGHTPLSQTLNSQMNIFCYPAPTQQWDHHITDGYKRSHNDGDGALNRLGTWDGKRSSASANIIEELGQSSMKAYGSASKLNKLPQICHLYTWICWAFAVFGPILTELPFVFTRDNWFVHPTHELWIDGCLSYLFMNAILWKDLNPRALNTTLLQQGQCSSNSMNGWVYTFINSYK